MIDLMKPTTAGALAVAGALFSACGGPPHPEAPAERPPVEVAIATATVERIAEPVVASGGVEPWTRVSPGTKILGRISAVLVDEGERVRRGQLLARMQDDDLEAAVEQARAAVRMAEAQLANAATQAARMGELHGRGSVTDKNLEDATAALRVAEAAVDQARANLAAAEVTLDYSRIRSPIDGWVVSKRVEAGDMASPGRPFFVVEDLSRVKVSVEVGEATVANLAAGDPATVSVGGLAGELEAVIHRVVPAGDPASRTFTVRLVLDNPQGRIRSGMFARARFAGVERDALLVPAAALVTRGQLEGLFVVEEGRARLRWVRRGRAVEDRVEILSGLEAGERFVRQAHAELTDGGRVVEGS